MSCPVQYDYYSEKVFDYALVLFLLECRMMASKRTGTQAARIVVVEDEVAKLKAINWPEYLSSGMEIQREMRHLLTLVGQRNPTLVPMT